MLCSIAWSIILASAPSVSWNFSRNLYGKESFTFTLTRRQGADRGKDFVLHQRRGPRPRFVTPLGEFLRCFSLSFVNDGARE